MKTNSLFAPLLSLVIAVITTASAQPTTFTYQGHLTASGTNFNGTGQFKFALVTGTNTARQATATATLSGQFVTGYNVTDGGNGYTTAPLVTVTAGGGSGATAHATVNSGAVNSVVADQAGSGYTSAPTVTIAPPPASIQYTTYWSNDGTSANGSEPSSAISNAVNNGVFRVVLGDTTVQNMSAIDASLFSQPNLQLRIWFSDGVSAFVPLDPPQLLTPTPYSVRAITASNVVGLVSTSQLSGTVANNQLAHNSVTVTAGTGLSGGGTVALGGTTTVNNTGVTSLSSGGGITVSAANGAVSIGSTATSANAASTIVSRDTNGDFSNRTISLTGNINLPTTTSSNGIITAGGLPLIHTFGTSNFFAGINAGNLSTSGFQNTAVGNKTMPALTLGDYNTACGDTALFKLTSGSDNTAMGEASLLFNTIGGQNTSIGAFTLYANISGSFNTGTGYSVLGNNTTGSYNTADGTLALAETTGSYNTATGAYALTGQDGNSGSTNCAYGYSALWHNVTGNYNVAIGSYALAASGTGNNNIAVGYNAGSSMTTGSGNIDIGNTGFGDESNTIRIGTSQTKAVMIGIYGVTIASGGTPVYVNGSGLLGTSTSSARFKTNIEDMASTSDAVLKLRPVTFNYKKDIDPDANPQFGLIAEEVEKVNPNLIVRDPQGRPYSVRYEAVNAMLLNEFLKEHHKVEEQTAKIDELQKDLSEIKATLAKVASHLK